MSKSGTIRKVFTYMIPLFTLVVFLIILSSVGYLKNHTEEGKQIPKSIDQIESQIQNESWDDAISETKNLNSHWNTLTTKIEISTTEDDIKQFSRALARMEGYLKGKEQGSALAEIGLLKYTWGQLED